MESIFGNASSARTTRWEPEPTRRGTFGILSSCLITLGLCIWTAVHLNLPARDEAPWDWMCRGRWWKASWPWPGQTLRKGAWTILGFLAPEVVAFAAYRQYKTASKLMADMNELREAETGPKRREWSLTHSYFAVMGGFELALPDADFLPCRLNGRPRTSLILTPGGVRLLAEWHPDLIPDLSEQQIQDKSKGSAFAKTVVCFQATWFCIQCLARFGQRLGISLLELNTLGHALCTLAIYLAWWHKPLDVAEPVQITLAPNDPSADERHRLVAEKQRQLIAAMCVESKLDRRRYEHELVTTEKHGSDFTFKVPIERKRSSRTWTISTRQPRPSTKWNLAQDRFMRQKHRTTVTFTTPGATGDQPVNIQDHTFQDEWVDIPGCDISRWVLAHELGSGRLIPNDLVCDRTPNFPPPGYFQDDWLLWLGFCLLGLIYGGLHCAAWNAPFATDVEALLWRISSVAASSACILLPILWELSSEDQGTRRVGKPMTWVFRRVSKKVDNFEDSSLERQRGLLSDIRYIAIVVSSVPAFIIVLVVRWAFFFGFILLYCVARVYLVVECFINLAHLPDSAFQVPQWSQYMPHIS